MPLGETRPTRITSLLLAVALAVIGCSTVAGPSLTPNPSVAATAESPPASANVSVLEGHWATGPIPIADIKASGNAFTHSEETPNIPMEVGESGTFALSGTQLVLTPGEPGNIDTYTLAASLSGEDLSLQWVASTEEGTAGDKETHRRFTIAFYCSAMFKRADG